MKWSILVLTQPTRGTYLRRLLDLLEPQVKAVKGVDIVIRQFDPKHSLGHNRELLRHESAGEYLNFIDDDDLIADDYVQTILPLLDGVDQVTFRVRLTIDSIEPEASISFISLKYGCWSGDQRGWYRDFSHVCPMRRELALKVAMEGGHGEDSRWADGMRQLGIVKTEHVIDRILYLYLFRSQKKEQSLPVLGPVYPQMDTEKRLNCPKCGNAATVPGTNGQRCNQCGFCW